MSVKQIIKELCETLGLSQRELSKAINRDPAVLSRAKRENKLPRGVVDAICVRFPQICHNYMETGDGEILQPDRDLERAVKDRMVEMIMDSFSKLSPEVQSILLEAFRRIEDERGEKK
ncbi:MAG: hypothetical protein IKE69_02265 [Thermoguttaceae bacterium]|nr:hypothetical protein [Thermoguttaceae bacterium]